MNGNKSMALEDEDELAEEMPWELTRQRRNEEHRPPPSQVPLGKHEKSVRKHLAYALARVRLNSFQTMKQLAFNFDRKPERWAFLLRDFAIEQGQITKAEWQSHFRGRGRPKKGKPRGPYKKRNTPST